jgi:polyhydroxybutyrate depolymerase
VTSRTISWLCTTLVVGCFLLVGCSPTSRPQIGSASPVVPTAPESVSPTPSGRLDAVVVGGDRPVKVAMPPGLDPNVPAPLLMLLHGYGSSGDDEESYLHLGPAAAMNGMIYLHPDGTRDSNGARFWNATDACCNVDGSAVDDSSYLAGLITEVGSRVAVDPRRVFVVGHSNGAFMSYRMACDHADTIAAIVSLAGAPPANPTACRPSEPVAILQVQGSADDQVRVEGGSLTGNLAPGDERLKAYPPLEASLAEWATFDACGVTRTPTTTTLDLDRTLVGVNGPNETRVSAYGRCHPGGGVELWMIQGGGHGPDFTVEFGARVVEFLLSHPKPG